MKKVIVTCAVALALAACKKPETTVTTTTEGTNTTVETTVPADTVKTETKTETATPDEDVSTIDKFIEGSTMEVKLGNLAQSNASNQKVKELGKMMIQDHTKGGDDLKAMAKKKNWKYSEDLGAEKKAKYDEMASKKGADFDKAYSSFMVEDHKQDIADYKKASADVKDAELKAYAAKTIPTLEHHLKMAEEASAAASK